jgi:hypothetical protein
MLGRTEYTFYTFVDAIRNLLYSLFVFGYGMRLLIRLHNITRVMDNKGMLSALVSEHVSFTAFLGVTLRRHMCFLRSN